MLYFVVYGNTNVIFLTVREYREYQCYLFDCTGIPGIPMLSFVVEWQYTCYLCWLNENTNVIFCSWIGIQMLSFVVEWEYKCYLCWLNGNINVKFVGWLVIPMLSLLFEWEYKCYLLWLNGNKNVIFWCWMEI